MWFPLPIICLILAILLILIISRLKSRSNLSWFIAICGGVISFLGVLLWQLDIPASVALPPWQPIKLFLFSPGWLVDGNSWSFALSITALACAGILCSSDRDDKNPFVWSGILFLALLAVLAVSAANPLTLILVWTAIDFFESLIRLALIESQEKVGSVILSFSLRILGTSLFVWSAVVGAKGYLPMSWNNISAGTSIFIFLASLLRLGIFSPPAALRNEILSLRGLATTLHLIPVLTALVPLIRIPLETLPSTWTPYLLGFYALLALVSGWLWLGKPGDVHARHYWVLGIGALASASILYGSTVGTVGWGLVLILNGGLVFLFLSPHRRIPWFRLLGLWGLLALPFSPSAGVWIAEGNNFPLSLILLLPAQALMAVGYGRHVLKPSQRDFVSRQKWGQTLYMLGLLLLLATLTLLGLWGWQGASMFGPWWISLAVVLLGLIGYLLSSRRIIRLNSTLVGWGKIFQVKILERVFNYIWSLLLGFVRMITSTLEGEGGLFWSILLLVLLLTLLAGGGG